MNGFKNGRILRVADTNDAPRGATYLDLSPSARLALIHFAPRAILRARCRRFGRGLHISFEAEESEGYGLHILKATGLPLSDPSALNIRIEIHSSPAFEESRASEPGNAPGCGAPSQSLVLVVTAAERDAPG